jgi:hypothetical protein
MSILLFLGVTSAGFDPARGMDCRIILTQRGMISIDLNGRITAYKYESEVFFFRFLYVRVFAGLHVQ